MYTENSKSGHPGCGIWNAFLAGDEGDVADSYGIIKGEPTDGARTMRVLDMVEKPAVEDAPSRMAVLGRYIITPAIFDILAHTLPGKGG